MKHYELSYLITPVFSEEELKNFTEKINNFVLEEKGVLDNALKPVRKKLGYSIKKNEEGFLATLYFSLTPGNLANLEKKLKSENQILRYIILTKKAPKKVSIAKPSAKEEKPPKVLVKKPTKVELKEIDKKIEEILGE